MPSKKNKGQGKTTSSETISNKNKCVLLRDLSTGMLLIVDYNDISTSKTSKIGVGLEVMYVATNRIHGRGTILLIGFEEECMDLLVLLGKGNVSKANDDSQSALFVEDSERKSDEASEEDEPEQATNKEKEDIIVTKYVDSANTNINNTVSTKPSSESNKRTLPLTNKTSNENDENSAASKRLKYDNDDSDTYLRGRIMVLQEENKKLKNKIEEMETTWMPRPDPVTISYFAKLVSICAGEDKDYEDSKGDKLAKIMHVLGMTEAELAEHTDSKSIRSTCRKLVRVVFKKDFANAKTRFGTLLKDKDNKEIISAIRDYGRLMHLLESLQFTNGDLNNAMGSDFYQRDRGLKQHQSVNEDNDEKVDSSDDSS